MLKCERSRCICEQCLVYWIALSLDLEGARYLLRGQMLEHNKNNQSVRGEFYWVIPGDVPGYRDQPDPFQSIRRIPDADYQFRPRLDSQQTHKTMNPASLALQTAAGSNTSEFGQTRVNKLFKNLAVFILLLFMPGIGVVGYDHYVTHEVTPIAIAQAKPINEPKIFKLTLGKHAQTSKTKLRVVTHVVVKGDTLWDIAEVYVKNPFRYPELAKLSNIKDPDLIYPYDLVRIHIYE